MHSTIVYKVSWHWRQPLTEHRIMNYSHLPPPPPLPPPPLNPLQIIPCVTLHTPMTHGFRKKQFISVQLEWMTPNNLLFKQNLGRIFKNIPDPEQRSFRVKDGQNKEKGERNFYFLYRKWLWWGVLAITKSIKLYICLFLDRPPIA